MPSHCSLISYIQFNQPELFELLTSHLCINNFDNLLKHPTTVRNGSDEAKDCIFIIPSKAVIEKLIADAEKLSDTRPMHDVIRSYFVPGKDIKDIEAHKFTVGNKEVQFDPKQLTPLDIHFTRFNQKMHVFQSRDAKVVGSAEPEPVLTVDDSDEYRKEMWHDLIVQWVAWCCTKHRGPNPWLTAASYFIRNHRDAIPATICEYIHGNPIYLVYSMIQPHGHCGSGYNLAGIRDASFLCDPNYERDCEAVREYVHGCHYLQGSTINVRRITGGSAKDIEDRFRSELGGKHESVLFEINLAYYLSCVWCHINSITDKSFNELCEMVKNTIGARVLQTKQIAKTAFILEMFGTMSEGASIDSPVNVVAFIKSEMCSGHPTPKDQDFTECALAQLCHK